MKKKVVTIVGVRPQFIKAAMVSRALQNFHEIEEVIIHTGQHFDSSMSNVFFDEMDMPNPTYNLGINSLAHGAMTGRFLEKIEEVLIQQQPDFVLVYGDTNSTLAGSLAAAKLQIPVAHVEAGLRSFNRRMPEEINRILTDNLSTLLFTPTTYANLNLLKEGFSNDRIFHVGDVMYDAALYFGYLADRKSNLLDRLSLQPRDYFLATIHRQENADHPERLRTIFDALAEAPIRVVIPLHPRTKMKMIEYGIESQETLTIIDPVGYLDMLALEKNARKVFTDSGGVQKEAFFFNIPCATLREETEWTELLEIGANTLVGADRQLIRDQLYAADQPCPLVKPYGNGDASKQIALTLSQ